MTRHLRYSNVDGYRDGINGHRRRDDGTVAYDRGWRDGTFEAKHGVKVRRAAEAIGAVLAGRRK